MLRYLSLTTQQFALGKTKSLEIWMQVFENVVADYLKNVDRIIKNPNSKVRTIPLHAKADHIKRWSPVMEEEYYEKKSEKRLDEHYFRYEVYENTVNTLENRFVKHTLLHVGRKLDDVFCSVLKRNITEISSSYFEKWSDYQHKMQRLLRHPFFKSVGSFEGLNQESLVLQSRIGYQQVYKDWLKLKKGIDFYQGVTNVGTLQIWEIYELWCFIKVKQMLLRILRLDPKSPLISEPNGTLINYQKILTADKRADYRLTIKYPTVDDEFANATDKDDLQFIEHLAYHKGEVISLHYQHTFSRLYKDDIDAYTRTTEQRPDIILNITKADGEVLTYLFDAKYRVWSDRNLDKPEDWYDDETKASILRGADFPPADAINQMHRYRDAIYYSMKNSDKPTNKEIVGGYILFPGRGDDKTVADRFYSKSIQEVNIGAFPLLPCGRQNDTDYNTDIEGPQLFDHLRDIVLLRHDYIEHVADSIPQRGLHYSDEIPRGLYLIASVGETKEGIDLSHDVFKNGTAEYYISGHSPSSEIKIQKVKFLAPVISHYVYGYYKVTDISLTKLDIEGVEQPYRIRYKLDKYTALPSRVKAGIDRINGMGWTLPSKDFASQISDGILSPKH